MKADLKEIYFKLHDIFPFKKYVNMPKEAYNTLEALNQSKFEEHKVITLIDHIMYPGDQVKACVHNAKKRLQVRLCWILY